MANQELHSGKLTVENMQALIEQSRVIPVEMTQVRALEEMKGTVNAWLERASGASPPTFSTLSNLVRDGEATNLILPGLAESKGMLQRAEVWMDEAFTVLHLSRKVPREQMISSLQSTAQTTRSGKRKREGTGAEPSSNKPSVPAIQALLDSAAKSRIVLWEVAALDGMLKEATTWCAEVAKLVGTLGSDENEINDPRRESHADESEAVLSMISRGKGLRFHADELLILQRIAWFHRKRRLTTGVPTLDEIDVLLDDAARLQVPDESTLELQELSASGSLWRAKHKAVHADIVTLAKLEELVLCADSLRTIVPEAVQLKSKIAPVKVWLQKAKAAIAETTHMTDLADLVHEALSLPVDMGDTLEVSLKSINEKVRSGQSFSERVRRKLRKSTIEACAEAVGVPPFAFTGSLAPPKDRTSSASKNTKLQKAEGMHCNCMQDKGGMPMICTRFNLRRASVRKYDRSSTEAYAGWMVECDSCNVWYHGKCVNAKKSTIESTEQFMCPRCAHQAGVAYMFDRQPVRITFACPGWLASH